MLMCMIMTLLVNKRQVAPNIPAAAVAVWLLGFLALESV